jgi:hypothetical protein
MPAPSGLNVANITASAARLQWTPVAPTHWRLTVQTTGAGQDYTVNIAAGTTPNIDIDWGDGGAVENFTSTGQKTHTFTSAGTYTVKISGSFASGGNIRLGSNAGNRARLKATGAIPLISGLVNFRDSFSNCTGITAIPTDLFRYNTAVSTSGFYATFQGCTGITAIPTDLFRYNTAVSSNGFNTTFYGCTGITAIPTDLFRYNTAVSTSGFQQTFYGCAGITAIPTGLFDYNTAVSTSGFYATFQACTGITSIPTDLFRYNTAVSTSGFNMTFRDCASITEIPTDLFRYNTLVSTNGFERTFFGCSSLATAPALLFKYNTACTSFYQLFMNCSKLQLRADLFFDTGEESTRFLNKSVDFLEAMRIVSTFTGTQGTAPALWTCDFGTGTPTTTNCFTGHTTSSVTNHASIPTAWGGPA